MVQKIIMKNEFKHHTSFFRENFWKDKKSQIWGDVENEFL